jgi:hypothetical protein
MQTLCEAQPGDCHESCRPPPRTRSSWPSRVSILRCAAPFAVVTVATKFLSAPLTKEQVSELVQMKNPPKP